MKKITFMIATAIMFAACNGGSAESTTTDSVIVDSVSVVDSVAVADSAVSVIDTTTAQIPVNGGSSGGGRNELGPRPNPIK